MQICRRGTSDELTVPLAPLPLMPSGTERVLRWFNNAPDSSQLIGWARIGDYPGHRLRRTRRGGFSAEINQIFEERGRVTPDTKRKTGQILRAGRVRNSPGKARLSLGVWGAQP